ncbi:hypothetical protein Tco_0448806 [Tanacetum coccineum]
MSSSVSSAYHLSNDFESPLLEIISSTKLEEPESNSLELEELKRHVQNYVKDGQSSVGDDDEIKLKDLTGLVNYIGETEDISVPPPLSPKSIKIQELTNQLTELLVNALKPELTQLLTNHDFSASIPTELKEIPFKVATLEDFKLYLLAGLLALPEQVSSINVQLTKLKVLDALPSLLNKVVAAMDRFATAIVSASQKAGDHNSPFLTSPPKTTPQIKGEQFRDKGNKAMSHEEVAEEESDNDSDTNSRPSGTLEESLKHKPLRKFTYINENGERFQMTQEEIENQKCIKQAVKANVDRSEIKKGKKDLIDIVGFDVVEKVYKDKMRQKLDALYKIEEELELDLSKPLEEQNPMIKMNLLARKKRKNDDDLHDYFKSIKSSKPEDKALSRASVQLGWQFQAKRCRSPLRS